MQVNETTEVKDETTPAVLPVPADAEVQEPVKEPASEAQEQDPTTEAEQVEGDSDAPSGDDDLGGLEFYYGDTQVTLDIPEEAKDAVTKAGLTMKEVLSSMYSKGGTGKPSQEIMDKLANVYGKFAVESYFSTIESQNKQAYDAVSSQEAELDKADEALWAETLETVGGEEGWSAIEAFAVEHLSDQELEGVNAVMSNAPKAAQMLVLQSLQAKMKAHTGDSAVKLVDGDAANPAGDDSPLSREQYIQSLRQVGAEFKYDKAGYAAAVAKLDARRRAAM